MPSELAETAHSSALLTSQ